MSDNAARSSRPRQLSYPYMRSVDINKGRYYREVLKGQSLNFAVSAAGVPAFPTASATQRDTVFTPGGLLLDMYQTTAQTIHPVWDDSNGLEISLDQVDNETVEYVPGGNSAFNPFAFVVGTDPNFFFRCKFKLDDASFSDQFGIGFRKQEAFATPTSFLSTGDGIYVDFFLLGFAGTKADPNPIRTSSDVGNGGSSTVSALNFTWADAKTHQLEIRVIGGKAFCFINGVLAGDAIALDGDGGAITSQQTVTGPSYTFTSGLTLVPFIFCRQDADVGHVYLREIEIGLLRDIGKDKNSENRGE